MSWIGWVCVSFAAIITKQKKLENVQVRRKIGDYQVWRCLEKGRTNSALLSGDGVEDNDGVNFF